LALERNDVQRQVAAAAREFLAEAWTSEALRGMRAAGGFPGDRWSEVARLGWFDLLVPEAEGGAGLGPVEAGALLEEVGRALFPGPVLETVFWRPVLQREGLLRRADAVIAVGRRRAWLGGRADPLVLARGALTGGGVVAGFGDIADWLILAAREDGEPVVLAIEPTVRGLDVRRRPSVDLADRPCLVSADRAPVTHVLARGHVAGALSDSAEAHAWVMTAAELLGITERVLEMSVEYARQRTQFGRPVGSFQAVQHELADVAMRCRTLRSICYLSQVALAKGAGPEAARVARVAKAYASRSGRQAVETALQVHGGIGFTEELDLHLYLKRALTLQAAWGDQRDHERALGVALRNRVAARRGASPDAASAGGGIAEVDGRPRWAR
jgi:alkylation response protein AidB-like acyl-CoA dehydrogenase